MPFDFVPFCCVFLVAADCAIDDGVRGGEGRGLGNMRQWDFWLYSGQHGSCFDKLFNLSVRKCTMSRKLVYAWKLLKMSI